MKARDIMTTNVVTITPQTGVREIAALLARHRISGVPVLEGGRLAGIVSEGDLLRRHEIGTEARYPSRRWWLGFLRGDGDPAEYVKSHAVHAADVMTRKVVSVEEETPAAVIAGLFERRRIKRVPVMRGGELVGIVTRADLVRALAATAPAAPVESPDDGEIRARLLAELAGHSWWHAISNVIVADGVVELYGFYDSEEARRAARVAAENIPGVRRIEDRRISDAQLPAMG